MKPEDELQLLYRHFCAVAQELDLIADQHRTLAEGNSYWVLFAPTIQDQERNRKEATMNKGLEDGYRKSANRITQQIQLYKADRDRKDADAKPKIHDIQADIEKGMKVRPLKGKK